MFPDIPFFIAFSLLAFVILGIAGLFIKKTMKNFQEMTATLTTDTEQLAAATALARVNNASTRFVLGACLIVCTLAGVGALVLASFEYGDTRAFLDKAQKAKGTIARVDLVHAESGVHRRSSTAYYPRFTFQAPTGEMLEILSQTGVADAAYYRQGQIVDVFYDPSNPVGAKLSTFFQLWSATLIFFAVGIVFLLFPIGYGIYRLLKK